MNKRTEQDQELRNDKSTYLALGDSYTIGERVEEKERWPIQLVDKLHEAGILFKDPVILATTGWRTDELKNAMGDIDGYDFDLVSLQIGVNNQYQDRPVDEYEVEFRELLEMAVERAGGQEEKVIVVSIPDYGYTPFGMANKGKISRELDIFNNINKTITSSMGVRYFNITPISRKGLEQPELVASDGLHPSGLQYARWVSTIMEDRDFINMLRRQRKG